MRRSIFRALASYAVMGAALGVALGLALIWIPSTHVASLIGDSMERWTTMLVVCTLMATFSVDAALTGFLLLMIEDDGACRRAQKQHLR